MYRGPFNSLIKDLATDKHYRELLQIDLNDPNESKKVQKMEDVEYVLRFFAVSSGNYKNIKKGFRDFLSDEMQKMNLADKDALAGMAKRFTQTMAIIRHKFGERKRSPNTGVMM